MIFARLTQRWHALRYWREHQRLNRLAAGPLQVHARFEDATCDGAYRDAIRRDAGLVLWQHDGEHGRFALRLQASHDNAQGELTLSLMADGAILHRLCWTWVDGALFDGPPPVVPVVPVVPLITRNAGLWRDAGPAFEAFERAFPNNSPSFFTFAALQGAAQALGIERVIAVRAKAHPDYEAAQHAAFENAYDGFWRILGGVETNERTCTIALPFYLKPLQDMPSKHRKRAAQRREHWAAIGEAARSTLLRHMTSCEVAPAIAQHAPETAKA